MTLKQKTPQMREIEGRLNQPIEEILPDLLARFGTLEGAADWLRSVGCDVSYATLYRWCQRFGFATEEQARRKLLREDVDAGYVFK